MSKLLKIRSIKGEAHGPGSRKAFLLCVSHEKRETKRKFPNIMFHFALAAPKPEDGWDRPMGSIHQVLFDEYLSTLEES